MISLAKPVHSPFRQGFPNIRTVDYWLGGNTGERYPQSRTMEVHNKADGWQRRLEVGSAERGFLSELMVSFLSLALLD